MTAKKLSGFERVEWYVFLRAKREQKVELFLRQFGEALGCEVTIRRCERYWKDKALFDFAIPTPLCAEDICTATFETLRLCRRILPHWTVTGPTDYEGER